jgi:formylglycine-generating enzyme required for sulfatase activity
VTLNDYYIGETEVTQAQWKKVMGTNPSYFSGCNDCPVEKVSWDDVQLFLSRLNERMGGFEYRLPTEAEWEYAARGGNMSRSFLFAGSDDLDAVGWFADNSGGKTHPVRKKTANELGLYDMSGNVWEWCLDWYANYSGQDESNPRGAVSGLTRVRRGGSWGLNSKNCRISNRNDSEPDYRNNLIGFRLVAVAKQ